MRVGEAAEEDPWRLAGWSMQPVYARPMAYFEHARAENRGRLTAALRSCDAAWAALELPERQVATGNHGSKEPPQRLANALTRALMHSRRTVVFALKYFF